MELMRTVEDSFLMLEELGMERTEQGVMLEYRFIDERDKGAGCISVLGEMDSHYYTQSEYQVTREFYQKYLIEECYLEFGRLQSAEGFYYINEESKERITLDAGISVLLNRSTGAANWMYCPAGVACKSQSFIVREKTYLAYVLPVIHERYGDGIDHFTVIQKAAERCKHLCQGILHECRSCSYQGKAARVFLDAKLAEFMAALIYQIESVPQADIIALSDFERQAIEQAQEILRTELTKPPTMKELARRIGCNPNKMQAAFKQITGVTAGEYLRSYRMEKALEYLACDILLEDIAQRVGYKSASRFSEAFQKNYGILPSYYRKIKYRGADNQTPKKPLLSD